jgi:microcystin-dependent protein
MSYTAKHWKSPMNITSNDLNELELGVQEAHENIERVEKLLPEFAQQDAKMLKELRELSEGSSDAFNLIKDINTLLESNNDIAEILKQNSNNFLSKHKQTLTNIEREQVLKNLGLNKYVMFEKVLLNGKEITTSSLELSIPSIDGSLNLSSNNPISNAAVALAFDKLDTAKVINHIVDHDTNPSSHTDIRTKLLEKASINFVLEQLDKIEIPNVLELIQEHNENDRAHKDIRDAIKNIDLSGYALSNHNHDEVYSKLHDHPYASSDHTHPYATPEYVDNKISSIPTPDVSGQINAHNDSDTSHYDIRKSITDMGEKFNDYALTNHNHDNKYSLKHDHPYAAEDHNHDGRYSLPHEHPYAAENHNHDSIYAQKEHEHDYAPANHTHGYATQSDIDTAIANLVGSAPDALNTFEELAAALNNNKDILSTFVTLGTAQTITGKKTFNSGLYVSGRWKGSGDDEGIIIGTASNGYSTLCLGDIDGGRATIWYNAEQGSRWNLYDATDNKLYYLIHPKKSGTVALTDHTHDDMYAPKSHSHDYLPLSGGTMSGPLVLTGGDAASGVGNMQLDTNGQITAKGTTSTLFGRNSATSLLLGHSSHSLSLRGSATRPTYNGKDIAMYGDIPTNHVTTDTTQTISGSKTFSGTSGFNYTGIENATSNSSRNVWFSHADKRGTPCYNDSFKYNPSTNTLTVGSITGNAATATKATQDENGNQISRIYCSMIPAGTSLTTSGTNLNTVALLKVGNYYCSTDNTTKTFVNCPTTNAFMMQVYSPLNTATDNETTGEWVYRVRKLMTYWGDEYIQYAYTSGTPGSYTFGSWRKIAKTEDIPTNNNQLTNGKGYLVKSDLLNVVYPVGSIYMSVNSTSPQSFLGGTWTQIQNTFLLAAGSSYSNGSTGGAATVSLTTANMPSHGHGVGTLAVSTKSLTGTVNYSLFTGGQWTDTSTNGIISQWKNTNRQYNTNGTSQNSWAWLKIDASHNHTLSGSTASNGSGTAHNNMPPYLAVYMWKRTA